MPEIHGPAMPAEKSDPVVERHNARLGMGLFAIYVLLYGAYVVINAVWPQWMDAPALAGLNFAVVYGLGLILGAFVLSVVYALLCKNPVKEQA